MTHPPKGCALVTGGAVRLGKAMSIALAKDGYDIAIHYRNSDDKAHNLISLIEEHGQRGITLQADLGREEETSTLIAQATEQLGPVTLLINNASSFENDSAEDMTRESWDLHMEVNLRTPLKLAQDFVAALPEGHNGQIINILDQRVRALTPKFFSYTISKSALWTATQTLAQHLGPKGIRVNGIGPGPTLRNARQSKKDWQQQNEATILGHGANLEEIVRAMRYLLNAKAVTGQMIAVDGGQHLAWETPDVMINE